MPESNPGWFDPQVRLPRKGQEVWVRTKDSREQPARFDVAFTHGWPQGVSWAVESQPVALRFVDVVLWIPLDAFPGVMSAPEALPEPREGEPGVPANDGLGLARELREALDHTATVLSVLHDGQMEWSPHPSIPTLRVLACRVVRIVARIRWMIELESVERSFEPDLPDLQTANAVRSTFSADADELDTLIDSLATETLQQPWTLERDGEVLTRQSRSDALRAYGLGPLLTHRAEMALLMTAMNVPVPHPYQTWTFEEH